MNEFIKSNRYLCLLILLSTTSISFAWSDKVDFWKSFTIITSLFLGMMYLKYTNSEKGDDKNEIIKDLGQLLEEQDLKIEEQDKVIEEYNKIFDSQLVELPCVCGGNTFSGLFSPKEENIVECEKCKNKYRVTIDYNSVLISEPMDLNQNFDQIVGGGQ